MKLTAGNGHRIQLPGPGHCSFEFYRSHGASTVPLLEMDDPDQARPSRPAAAPGYSAGRSQTAPGPGSPSGRPTGTSTARAPAWRSRQARKLWSNALDMRHESTVSAETACEILHKALPRKRQGVAQAQNDRDQRPVCGMTGRSKPLLLCIFMRHAEGHGDTGNLSCDRRTRPDSARSRRWCAAVILRRSSAGRSDEVDLAHLDFRGDISAKSVEELSGLVRQGGGEAGGERRDRGPEFLATSDVEGERDSGQPLLGVHRRVARAADEDAPA